MIPQSLIGTHITNFNGNIVNPLYFTKIKKGAKATLISRFFFLHIPPSLSPSSLLLPNPNPNPKITMQNPPAKKRGNYNCGKCGLPKKGHICPSPPHSDHRLRRALSFDSDEPPPPEPSPPEPDPKPEDDFVPVGTGLFLPESCLAKILRRLSPKELMGAAMVCGGWRDCVRTVWRSAEEIRVRVSRIGFVGSMLHRCGGLARLSLIMERFGVGNFGCEN